MTLRIDEYIIIHAVLELADDQRDAWLRQPFDRRAVKWLEARDLFSGSRASELDVVGDLFAAGSAASLSFLELIPEQPTTVSGAWTADEFLAWHEDLAAAVAVAPGGATLYLLIPTLAVVRIRRRPDKRRATIKTLEDGEELPAEVLAAFEGTQAWLLAKDERPELRRERFRADERDYALAPLPDAPGHAALLAALSEIELADLHAAAAQAELATPDGRSLATLYPNAESLGSAVAAGEPAVRVCGLSLLAAIRPTVAEPIAIALLDDRSRHVRARAYATLGGLTSSGALEVLLTMPTGVQLASVLQARSDAIVHSRHPAASHRILDLLDAELPAWRAELRADASAAPAQRLERAGHLLELLILREVPGAAVRLLEFFDPGYCIPLRRAIASALHGMDGAEVEAHRQQIIHALFGMGLALNQDDARRAELLGVDTSDDLGGITRFGGLRVGQLTALLEEGFLDPESRQNDAPSAAQFYDFLTTWTEATVEGYAVSQRRDDYRVMVDGISCETRDLPDERRASLRAAFVEFCHGAGFAEPTQLEVDDESLHSWWT